MLRTWFWESNVEENKEKRERERERERERRYMRVLRVDSCPLLKKQKK